MCHTHHGSLPCVMCHPPRLVALRDVSHSLRVCAMQTEPPPHLRYRRPYKPRAELMVQILTSVLAQHKCRKHLGDDLHTFAASLRWQKSEMAYLEMVSVCRVGVPPRSRPSAHVVRNRSVHVRGDLRFRQSDRAVLAFKCSNVRKVKVVWKCVVIGNRQV
jgi:hypothetical protein